MKKIKEIKELLLTIVCLMNSSTENNEICEVMDLIEKEVGSSLPLWRKFSSSEKGTSGGAIQNLKRLLKEL